MRSVIDYVWVLVDVNWICKCCEIVNIILVV